MRIAVLQGASIVLDVAANLAVLDAAAARAAAAGADVLLTPELFTTGYAPAQVSAALSPGLVAGIDDGAAAIAARHSIALAYSSPTPALVPADGPAQQGSWHIGAVLVDATGAELLRYAKVHLFGAEERAAFVPGSAAPGTVELAGLRVGLLVCYDAEFPESVRALATAGAEVVLVPTALSAGFNDVPQVLLRARALESQVALAYANHVGPVPLEGGATLVLGGGSIVAGPDGRVLAQGRLAPASGEDFELLLADVNAEDITRARDKVPYLQDRRPDLYSDWAASGPAENRTGSRKRMAMSSSARVPASARSLPSSSPA